MSVGPWILMTSEIGKESFDSGFELLCFRHDCAESFPRRRESRSGGLLYTRQ